MIPTLGSTAELQLEALDLGAAKLEASPLILFDELRESPDPDPEDALAALRLGANAVGARFGNRFAVADALEVMCLTYNAPVDPSTGEALLKATFEISNSRGQTLMRSPEQVFETAEAAVGVGPIPLTSLPPGEYRIELSIADEVGGTLLERETGFTVVAGGMSPAPGVSRVRALHRLASCSRSAP